MKIGQKWKPLPGFINFSTDPEVFDLDDYLARAVPDKEMLKYPETRRALTRANPLLFVLLYQMHHVNKDGIHFSHFHLSLYKWASGTWHQRSGLDDARDAFLASRGAGKALDVNERVLTANRGWVRHGDLVAGDQVFRPNSEPVDIINVAHWEDRPAYRVSFSDGSSLIADENHEWRVYDAQLMKTLVLETKELVARGLSHRAGDRFQIEGVAPMPLAKEGRSPKTITSIERVENRATNCITLADPEGMYLAGEHLTPTHNTTTLFNILPMWAACHEFVRFIAAYGDSEPNVQEHLETFKADLRNSKLIMEDYPHMRVGKAVWTKVEETETEEGEKQKDTASFLKTAGGFVFAVRSISSNSLGLKVGSRRPDLILLDDVEKAEGDYSVHMASKRLASITGGILPQSQPLGARVILVGTNLMQGSIIDGMIKKARGEEAPDWIDGQNFRVHWFRPFIRNDDGSKRSFWPGVWSTEFLLHKEATDTKFGMNFDNQPMAEGGAFWELSDFEYGSIPTDKVSLGILSIDPATTSTRRSDFTAFAVVLYSRSLNRYELVHSSQAKLTPAQIRAKAEQLISIHPEITAIHIETTQGGDTWLEIFKDIPVKIVCERPSLSKELRATRALNIYQTVQQDGSRRVLHRTKFPDLEAQMRSFPRVTNDDLVDSVTQAVNAIEARLFEQHKRRGRRGPVVGAMNRLRR